MSTTEAQADEHEALIQFLYMAPIGLAQTRLDGEIVMINPVCAQLLMPLSRDGGLANLFSALEGLAPDLRLRAHDFAPAHGMVCDGLQLQLDAGVPGHIEPRMLSLSLLKLDGTRLMAVLHDVTAACQRERQLRQSEAWFNAICHGVTDYALMPLNHAGRIDGWNPGIERLTGRGAQAVAGQTYSIFYPDDAMPAARVVDRLHEADQNGWSLDEGWLRRADGARFWGSCLIAPLQPIDDAPVATACAAAPEDRAYSLIIRDISEKREATEALRRAVSCDHLTGLANRRAFFDAGELEMRRWQRWPRPLSVVVFDADHFKSVNDQHGHAAGDALLRELGHCLATAFRGVDVAARIGGEEFAVLLPGTGLAAAAAAADRLCRQVAAQAIDHDGHVLRFTVSAGVATMEAGLAGLDRLLKRADAALYKAKAKGRNRVETWPADSACASEAPPSLASELNASNLQAP